MVCHRLFLLIAYHLTLLFYSLTNSTINKSANIANPLPCLTKMAMVLSTQKNLAKSCVH